jgi:hypothetical protein
MRGRSKVRRCGWLASWLAGSQARGLPHTLPATRHQPKKPSTSLKQAHVKAEAASGQPHLLPRVAEGAAPHMRHGACPPRRHIPNHVGNCSSGTREEVVVHQLKANQVSRNAAGHA